MFKANDRVKIQVESDSGDAEIIIGTVLWQEADGYYVVQEENSQRIWTCHPLNMLKTD